MYMFSVHPALNSKGNYMEFSGLLKQPAHK